ncbi:hypothetical protein Hanom_Chr04g00314111 [Helianthus anomalus]
MQDLGLMNRPKNIPVDDFSQMLRLWSNKDRCLRAKEIRMSQKNTHTAGPTSFAIIREEMVICLKFSSDSCSFNVKDTGF